MNFATLEYPVMGHPEDTIPDNAALFLWLSSGRVGGSPSAAPPLSPP